MQNVWEIEQKVQKIKFIRTMGEPVVAQLTGTLKSVVADLKKRRIKASSLDFKKWLEEAIQKGAGPVHANANTHSALPTVLVFEKDTDGVARVAQTSATRLDTHDGPCAGVSAWPITQKTSPHLR